MKIYNPLYKNLLPKFCLNVDFIKVDQYTKDKWFIHDTTHSKENHLQSWNSPVKYPSWVARCDTKGSDGSMLNPIFLKKVQGQKHPGRWEIAEPKILSVKCSLKQISMFTTILVLVYLS